jgi:CMP-N-acetylneuraminic acid synthetase
MPIKEIFIFARDGSKEIKNKNIIKIKGIPLIEFTINFAKKLKIKNIFVSTDGNKIKTIAKKNKTTIIDRPKNLALDNSPEISSWKHAINWYEKKFEKKLEYFISLPTTSPLRKKNDFLKAFKLFKKSKCDMLIAIYKPNHFPSFNIVKKFKKNNIKIYDSSLIVTNRQKVNNIFNIATCFYIAKRNYVMKTQNLFSGNVKGIEVDEESAFDLDTKFQLKILRKII